MTTEQTLVDLYENAFGDDIDKTSDTWKTFQSIMTLRPAFYNLMVTELELQTDKDFTESLQHLVWIFWEGSNPDGSSLGKTSWKELGDMFIQTKQIEDSHYG